MSLFVIVKFLHVLLAIIAVGFNATYGVWLARVAREPVPTQSFVLHGIKRLDDWFANPAYVLLAVTGVTMVFVGELRFTTFWIGGGIVLWAMAVALGFFVYRPMLRNQIRALEKTLEWYATYRDSGELLTDKQIREHMMEFSAAKVRPSQLALW